MENKRKVLIFDEGELDKQDFEEKISRLKDDISQNKNYTEKERQVIKYAVNVIENEKALNYDKNSNFKELLKDILDNNIELIIARNERTFGKIFNDPSLTRRIAANCSVYTLDGKINTISDFGKMQFKILDCMYKNYKEEADKRSRMGEKFHTKEVKIWSLDELQNNDMMRIEERSNNKLDKYKCDIKKGGFFQNLNKKIDKKEIQYINLEEINTELEEKYINCIITKDKDLIQEIKKSNKLVSNKCLYNKNVIICLVTNENIKFYMLTSVRICTRDNLEKYNKKISQDYIYNEI